VADAQRLEGALDEAFSYPGPYVLEVETDVAEECLPMVTPGGSLSEMTYGSTPPPTALLAKLEPDALGAAGE
jgi:hypothetical protein